jgi:4-hydroxy-4-methyl-2-oxoglutarate aldolase|tara:strand:+ start:652 stop:1332 length:681 start_codon:yes stop_codon:yes gene_type:complete
LSTEFIPRINKDLPEGCNQLNPAILSDVLDDLGITNQVMSIGMRPLDESLTLCGRARTGAYMEVPYLEEGINPYRLEIALVDDLRKNDVAVLSCGGSSRIAPWGGLLSTAAKARGSAGCVTDGYVRDIMEIRRLEFPVFAGGVAPLDSKGRGQIMSTDVPVICDGVRICPGDLVVGNADGVVVVPQEHELNVMAKTLEKHIGEDNSINELRAGNYLRDVFDKYGIL